MAASVKLRRLAEGRGPRRGASKAGLWVKASSKVFRACGDIYIYVNLSVSRCTYVGLGLIGLSNLVLGWWVKGFFGFWFGGWV